MMFNKINIRTVWQGMVFSGTKVISWVGVFPVGVARFLFWLGIVWMVIGVCGNCYTFLHSIAQNAIGYNAGGFVISMFSPLWQGGLLIGVAKILEKLHSKSN
jgi:hypothetical protein